jgi:hypothetical protein
MLYRVSAPRFVAGLVTDQHGRIVDTAPILGQWRGQQIEDLRNYVMSQKEWQLEHAEPARAAP